MNATMLVLLTEAAQRGGVLPNAEFGSDLLSKTAAEEVEKLMPHELVTTMQTLMMIKETGRFDHLLRPEHTKVLERLTDSKIIEDKLSVCNNLIGSLSQLEFSMSDGARVVKHAYLTSTARLVLGSLTPAHIADLVEVLMIAKVSFTSFVQLLITEATTLHTHCVQWDAFYYGQKMHELDSAIDKATSVSEGRALLKEHPLTQDLQFPSTFEKSTTVFPSERNNLKKSILQVVRANNPNMEKAAEILRAPADLFVQQVSALMVLGADDGQDARSSTGPAPLCEQEQEAEDNTKLPGAAYLKKAGVAEQQASGMSMLQSQVIKRAADVAIMDRHLRACGWQPDSPASPVLQSLVLDFSNEKVPVRVFRPAGSIQHEKEEGLPFFGCAVTEAEAAVLGPGRVLPLFKWGSEDSFTEASERFYLHMTPSVHQHNSGLCVASCMKQVPKPQEQSGPPPKKGINKDPQSSHSPISQGGVHPDASDDSGGWLAEDVQI